MSTSPEGFFARSGTQAAPPAPDAIGMGGERRQANRFKTAFRASCLIANGKAHIAMIKNMSGAGVMVELDQPLRVGQEVRYFWDEKQIIAARVIWSEGRRHGLENDELQSVFDRRFAYRSVRVPCSGRAEVWIEGTRFRPQLANLSLGGAQLSGVYARPGSLLTLRICGVDLESACARWSRPREGTTPALTGVAFAQRLTASQLSAILATPELGLESA